MTILGIDYGRKRIGLARSDGLNMFAHGIGYLENPGLELAARKIKEACDENDVTEIVVGFPRQMNGEVGLAAKDVLEFIEHLKVTIGLPVISWDERLSTKGASYFLKEAGFSSKKKKQKIDQLAAQIILQDYLDSQKAKGH